MTPGRAGVSGRVLSTRVKPELEAQSYYPMYYIQKLLHKFLLEISSQKKVSLSARQGTM